MTVPASSRRAGPFTGNGVAVNFPFAFKVFGSSGLAVVRAASGVETTLVEGPDYTVTLNPDQDASPGGAVTLTTALATGQTLAIVGAEDYDQGTDLPTGGKYSAVVVENALDKLTILLQQLLELTGRALTLPATSASANTTLPVPAAGNVIGWDATATALRNIDPTTLASIVAYANRRTLVANGGAASYTLAADPGNASNTLVAVSGVVQTPGVDYTVSGVTLTPTTPWPAGTGNVVIVYGEALPTGVTDAGVVNFLQAGALATPRSAQSKLRDTAVTPEDFLAGSESITTDAGPAIRRALATGRPVRFVSAYTVDVDPASAFNDGGNTRYSYSIKVPSNAALIFEEGSSITQKAGAQSWTRTVSMENATRIRVFGELRVDANVANVGAATNEHMHGVFLYNTTDTYIERIDSRNARGDNVFIGGTDEATNSKNVYIGSIRAVTAGRKNLVLQHFDNIHIGVANLDNASGGAAIYAGGVADDTDKHSLDVEPDTFTGAQWMRAWIGRLVTRGTGNDFTAGTTDAVGRKCVVTIGSFSHDHTSSTVRCWMQNAITINVGEMRMVGLAGVANPILIQYAAYLNVGEAYIQGAVPGVNDQMILAAVVSGGRPRVRFNHLHLVNTVGLGIENRDSDLFVGKLRAETAGVVLWSRGVSSTAGLYADTQIQEMEMSDVGQPLGAGYAVLHSASGTQIPLTTIGRIRFNDSRATKLNFIVSVGSGVASGFTVGVIDNATTVTSFQFQGSDKFYRVCGGGGFPTSFVGTGTPESMVAAPVGSTFLRTDGGAGTSFYVKQTGAGNTGWVGK